MAETLTNTISVDFTEDMFIEMATNDYQAIFSSNALVGNIDFSSVEVDEYNMVIEDAIDLTASVRVTFNQTTHKFDIDIRHASDTYNGSVEISYSYSVAEVILNRRLKKQESIVYPITRQENVIGLQKTIKEKLPISSGSEPEVGTYVEKQVWLDTSDDNELQAQIFIRLPRNDTNVNWHLPEENENTPDD